jgi:hypothetical protein
MSLLDPLTAALSLADNPAEGQVQSKKIDEHPLDPRDLPVAEEEESDDETIQKDIISASTESLTVDLSIYYKDFAYSPSNLLYNAAPLEEASLDFPALEDEEQEEDDDGFQDDSEWVDDGEEIRRRAIALFDFTPEHENEFALQVDKVVWIAYRHGQGWLVAEDNITGKFQHVVSQL